MRTAMEIVMYKLELEKKLQKRIDNAISLKSNLDDPYPYEKEVESIDNIMGQLNAVNWILTDE